MNKKRNYTCAEIDITLFMATDIITTSEGGIITAPDYDDIDKDAWT